MATPFKVFRDNQKVLMVVFGALLMVAFIILPSVLQYGIDSQRAVDEEGGVVVVVGDEELRAEQVRQLASKYDLVAKMVYAAMQQSAQLRGTPQPPLPPIPGLQVQPQTRQNPNGGLSLDKVPAEVAVRFYAWSKKADEMGIVVDDQSVRQFLSETAGGKLTDYDYNALLDVVVGERDRSIITYDFFFEQVRDVLKAQKLQALMIRDARVVTPTTAWVAYRNLNRTISTEMFPVAAEDYLAKVGEPTEAQVQELFDKYKGQTRNPMMNQIGFRPLDKIALAYIQADFSKFLEVAKTEVTDQQVAEYYEQNKESFRKPDLPSMGLPEMPAGEQAAPMETPAAETTEPAAEPMEQPMTEPEAKPEPMEEPTTETPAEPMAEAPMADEPMAEQPMAEEGKSEEPATEGPKPEQSSTSAASGGVQLVNFLQEEGAEQPAQPAQPEQPAAEPMTEAKPMEEKPAEDMVVADPTDTEAPETQPAVVPMEEAPLTPAPVEYRPLAEVQDDIRTQIARPLAQTALDEALAEIRAELQSQYSAYLYNQKPQDTPKSPYDSKALETMTTKLGLSLGALPLVDIYDALESELGQNARITEFVTSPSFQQVNRSLVYEVFQSSTSLFQPRVFPGPTSGSIVRQTAETQYIYWKTEEKKGYKPTLEDVRAEVVKTWKMLESQKLAKAAAEKIAKAVTDKESLAKAATEHLKTVTVADNITYFNQLSGQQNLTLGQIPGIPETEVSQDTMEALFSTAVGGTTVAPDRTENVFYVALVTGETESMEQLRDNFGKQIAGALPDSVMIYASQEENMVNGAILQDYFDPSHVEWIINPAELDSGV